MRKRGQVKQGLSAGTGLGKLPQETPSSPAAPGKGLTLKFCNKNLNFEGGLFTKNLIKERTGAPQETQHFKRRIGSTVFRVAVHFNPEARETAESKIARLIRSETGKAATA